MNLDLWTLKIRYSAIKDHNAQQFNAKMCHKRWHFAHIWAFFYSLAHFSFPCTLFVRFETFLELNSTPRTRRRTTTKLLLGPLSRARGQKYVRWSFYEAVYPKATASFRHLRLFFRENYVSRAKVRTINSHCIYYFLYAPHCLIQFSFPLHSRVFWKENSVIKCFFFARNFIMLESFLQNEGNRHR